MSPSSFLQSVVRPLSKAAAFAGEVFFQHQRGLATRATLQGRMAESSSSRAAPWPSAASAARGGQRSSPRLWTYFAVHQDWCDHLLFYENGTFSQGLLGGCGLWRLVPQSARDGSVVALQLQWQSSPGSLSAVGRGSEEELLALPGAGTVCFAAQGVRLECVCSSESLPLPGEEGKAEPLAPAKVESRQPRGLLFSSVGSQSLSVVQEHWLASPAALDFDVALAFYKEASSVVFQKLVEVTSPLPNVEVLHSPGMKWPNFLKWMEGRGGAASLAARYDYIWVVDDDVRLSTEAISRMFRLLREEHPEVEFACPSFDARSEGVWRYFDGHDPRFKLRYTDFVECTAPVLKISMLSDPGFFRCLQAARTGCFLDFCFFPAAGGRRDAVAVLDAVQCHHPPRGPEAPSEMRQLKKWEDHKEDDVYFEQVGVPREWYWFRQPQVFGGVPA